MLEKQFDTYFDERGRCRAPSDIAWRQSGGDASKKCDGTLCDIEMCDLEAGRWRAMGYAEEDNKDKYRKI